MGFDLQKHKQAIEDNKHSFDAEGAARYDRLEMSKVLVFLLVKVLAEFDPNRRKALEETETPIGDPTKPANGFTDADLPQAPATNILRPGVKLLDFACGTGLVTEKLVPYLAGAEITGIDISDDVLKLATEKMAKHDDVLFEALNRDILDLSAEENAQLEDRFDVIICTIAYHHLSNYKEITKKLQSFLAPGGWLLIVDFYNEDVEATADRPVVNSATKHMGGLKLSVLTSTFRDAGLEEVSAARELRTVLWQYEPFISSHCTQKMIDDLNAGRLRSKLGEGGKTVYSVEASLVLAAGRKPN